MFEKSAPVFLSAILLTSVFTFLHGCGGDAGTGVRAVNWDRDACDRCRMVLSDRAHSAQVRYFPESGRSRVMVFDDIGCAALWLQEQPWKDDPRTEIWVTDHRTGAWIEARGASYVTGHITPMEYGLGAQSDPHLDGMNFEQAVAHINAVETHFNAHGTDLLKRLNELKAKRETRRTSPDSTPGGAAR